MEVVASVVLDEFDRLFQVHPTQTPILAKDATAPKRIVLSCLSPWGVGGSVTGDQITAEHLEQLEKDVELWASVLTDILYDDNIVEGGEHIAAKLFEDVQSLYNTLVWLTAGGAAVGVSSNYEVPAREFVEVISQLDNNRTAMATGVLAQIAYTAVEVMREEEDRAKEDTRELRDRIAELEEKVDVAASSYCKFEEKVLGTFEALGEHLSKEDAAIGVEA